MKLFLVMVIAICTSSSFSLMEKDSNSLKNIPRKVKGKYYVTKTVVTKVVGAEGLSDELLQIMKSDVNSTMFPQNIDMVVGARGSALPFLITEKSKTTVTKISIPLSSTFLENEWYRETLKKFILKNKILVQGNMKEEHFSENGTAPDLILLKLFTAANLRDNILSLFKYLIYHPQSILPEDLYNALLLISNAIQLRRVPLINALENLKNWVDETIHNQFIFLFEYLEFLVPKHIRSSVTFWLECLYRKVINMNNVFESQGKISSFFKGIDTSNLNLISSKILFSESTLKKSIPKNEEIFGKTMSCILTDVLAGNIVLTPQLFAGMLEHLPLNVLHPDADVYQRYIVDVLKRDKEGQFIRAIKNLNVEQFTNPFDFTQNVLISLLRADYFIHRESIERLFLSKEKVLSPYITGDYQTMRLFINSPIKNFGVLLNNIMPDEYSTDIIHAKSELIKYTENGKNNFIIGELTENIYFKPTDLLVAILSKFTLGNYPFSNPAVASAANMLKTSITLKNALSNLKLGLTIEDIVTILEYFQNVKISPKVRSVASELRVMFQMEKIVLQSKLVALPTKICHSPYECITSIFYELISRNIITNENLKFKIIEMMKLIQPNGVF